MPATHDEMKRERDRDERGRGRDVKNNFLWLNFVFLDVAPLSRMIFFDKTEGMRDEIIWFFHSKMTKLCSERRYVAWRDVDFSIHTFNWSFHITQTSNRFSHGMHNILNTFMDEWVKRKKRQRDKVGGSKWNSPKNDMRYVETFSLLSECEPEFWFFSGEISYLFNNYSALLNAASTSSNRAVRGRLCLDFHQIPTLQKLIWTNFFHQ